MVASCTVLVVDFLDLWLNTSPLFKTEENGEYLNRRSNWVTSFWTPTSTFIVVNGRLDALTWFNPEETVIWELKAFLWLEKRLRAIAKLCPWRIHVRWYFLIHLYSWLNDNHLMGPVYNRWGRLCNDHSLSMYGKSFPLAHVSQCKTLVSR